MAENEAELDNEQGEDVPDDVRVTLGGRLRSVLGSRKRTALIAVGAIGSIAVGCWLTLGGPEEIPPEELLVIALERIDQPDDLNARADARDIAVRLQEMDYQSPQFSGAAEFILGLAAFRDAEARGDNQPEQNYLLASRFLKEAERRELIETRIPEWSYALGVSLFRIGALSEAQPLLEQARETYAPGRTEAALLLTETYLDSKSRPLLKKALQYNTTLVESKELDAARRDQAYLQRAQVCLLLNRSAEAEEALGRISQRALQNQATVVIRGQALMAEGQYRQAMDLLATIAEDSGLEQTYSAQAMYLYGVSSRKSGNIEIAISTFKRAALKHAKKHEGLAANLAAGELLRDQGRSEEALRAYRRALETVHRPEDFRNRWLHLDEFRSRVRDAWNDWADGDSQGASVKYGEAIKLARMMPPLFEDVQARRFEAIANQRWAEHLEEQFGRAPDGAREALRAELLARWTTSGEAFERLSQSLKNSDEFAEAVWSSARHYRNGHDFERALRQLTIFINTDPGRLLPSALVRRGEVLMDLNRLDEALESFQRVLSTHTTDPAWFEAHYVIGKCYLERNELDDAEKSWRAVLESKSLAPSAREWRLALYSLGTLLYHTAAGTHAQAMDAQSLGQTEKMQGRLTTAFARWGEAAFRLNEYLGRYPDTPEAIEARYFLALSLQRSAERHRRELASAETENARQELLGAMRTLLLQAIGEFQTLQAKLLDDDGSDRLNKLGRRILRDCYFQIAHSYYALEDDSRAIGAYHLAANRYPHDPHVLLAYVQMTNCNKRLSKPAQARSMLEQAKVILKQMPDTSFEAQLTDMNRDRWEEWLERASRLHAGGTQKPALQNQ